MSPARCWSLSRVAPGHCGAICGGPALSLPSRPHQSRPGHRVAHEEGPRWPGRTSPSRCPRSPRSPRGPWHPRWPRAGSPAPCPGRCVPKRGAVEGETRDLTWSDSSRSRDINLVCHVAVSRRGVARCGHHSPQTPGSRADGCRPPPRFSPRGPSSRGPGAAGEGRGMQRDGRPRLPPRPRGPTGVPPWGWITPSPQGPAPGLLPEGLSGWKPPGSLQPTLTSTGERRWIPVAAAGWLWNSRWPAWLGREIKYKNIKKKK